MVRGLSHIAATAVAIWAAVASAANCVTIQHKFPSNANGNASRANAVKDEYRYVWNQYRQQAFPKDELLPLNKSGVNDLFGWGASVIDGIDTAIIMGLTDIVKDQLNFIANFNFDRSVGLVNGFDAIIRYVGGLISAYDLINSPVVPKGTYNQTQVNALLKQAVFISNKLKPAFNTPYGLPTRYYNFTSNQYGNCDPLGKPCNNTMVSTAQVGTIILEWSRLSDLTGDRSYRDLAARAETTMITNQTLKYPYLVGTQMNYLTGKFTTNDVGWQANIDSFYEYLIKSYVYDPTRADTTSYKNYWVNVVGSTEKNLIKHPFQRPGLSFITQANADGTLIYSMDDYACFAGGNLLLGGQYLNNGDFKNLGYAVADSCHALFNTSEAGLNPSQWSWFNSQNKTFNPKDGANPYNVAYAKRAGYFNNDPSWGAYPEPLESIWYAYRISGDQRWQDYNWDAFQAMIRDTRNRQAGATFTQLTNVSQPLGGPIDNPALDNLAPAFLFAEVLKYFYLSFSPPSLISLDEWVFNTEGHPFKIKSGTCATSQ